MIIDPHKHILRQLLGILLASCDAHDERIYPLGIQLHQLGKGVFIAAGYSIYEVLLVCHTPFRRNFVQKVTIGVGKYFFCGNV
jgi:hypothetical protein